MVNRIKKVGMKCFVMHIERLVEQDSKVVMESKLFVCAGGLLDVVL